MTTSDQMLDRTGISYRQLDHWTRKGWLVADDGTPGTGNVRHWEFNEFMVALVMRAMGKMGIRAEMAAPIAREAVKAWTSRGQAYSFSPLPGLRVEIDYAAIEYTFRNGGLE